MDTYVHAPLALLLLAALAVAVQAFALNWACNICLMESFSYLRSAATVMIVLIANTAIACMLESNGIQAKSLLGLAMGVTVTTMLLCIFIPTDVSNALLILLLTLAVSGAAAVVVISLTNGAVLRAW